MKLKIKQKILSSLVVFMMLFAVSSSVYAFGVASIKNFSFKPAQDNKTEIVIDSTGKFQYFIHAQTNDLLIDIKGAAFPESLKAALQQVQANSSQVTGYSIEKIEGNINRIRLKLNAIKDFKFTVNAQKGLPAPYGFNMKPKVKLNAHVQAKENTPKQEKPLSAQTDQVFSAQKRLPQVKVVPQELSDDVAILEDLDLQKPHSKNSKRKQISVQARRLDESQVKIIKTPYKKVVSEEKKPEKEEPKEKKPQPDPTPVVKKPSIKPIPADELIKRLTENSSDQEMPRLVRNSKKEYDQQPQTGASQALQVDTNNLTEGQVEVVKEMVNNLQPLRMNGKELRPAINLDNHPTKNTDTSKIEVIKGVPEPERVDKPEKVFHLDTIKFKPRPVNSLSLGLAENFEVVDEDIADYLDLPKPKPAYNSDGSIAFKVVSSDGEYEGKVPLRKLDVIDNTNNIAQMGQAGFSEANRVSYIFKNLINRAKQHYEQNDYSQAEAAYMKAISVEPNKPWGYIAIAGFYEGVGQYEKSLRAYEKADCLLPGKAEILFNIAMNNYRNGNKMAAINNLLRVIKLSPDFTLAYYNLGTLYYLISEYENAVQCFKKAIALNPVLTDAHYNLGLAYSALNNIEMADRHLNHCISIDKEDSQCRALANQLDEYIQDTKKQ